MSLIFLTTLRDGHWEYTYYTDEATNAQRLITSSTEVQLMSGQLDSKPEQLDSRLGAYIYYIIFL